MIIKPLIVALSLLFPIHSWYPPECCGDGDCYPVACEELQEQTDGSIKYKDLEFSKDKVKLSKDKHCHVCHINQRTYCVFIHAGA